MNEQAYLQGILCIITDLYIVFCIVLYCLMHALWERTIR